MKHTHTHTLVELQLICIIPLWGPRRLAGRQAGRLADNANIWDTSVALLWAPSFVKSSLTAAAGGLSILDKIL